ncbi:MAG TPA: zf-HC2 domain-containing protein [Candidatus Acidoferrum sp.]|jgi:anti-sigma factor RsiW|nr:zf-HC2 domain-containing protein [Candidatus Acidoferrum sp.]
MTCRQVVELMTDYLDGALASDDRARFEAHIAGCDGCQAYLAQMRATRKVVGTLAEAPVPKTVEDELVKAFRDWKGKSS